MNENQMQAFLEFVGVLWPSRRNFASSALTCRRPARPRPREGNAGGRSVSPVAKAMAGHLPQHKVSLYVRPFLRREAAESGHVARPSGSGLRCGVIVHRDSDGQNPLENGEEIGDWKPVCGNVRGKFRMAPVNEAGFPA